MVEQERLDDTFVDALCEPAEVFTYGGMIAHVLTFAAHRRTLVALALAKHGVEELGWATRWSGWRRRRRESTVASTPWRVRRPDPFTGRLGQRRTRRGKMVKAGDTEHDGCRARAWSC